MQHQICVQAHIATMISKPLDLATVWLTHDISSLTLLFRRPGDTGLEILTPAFTWSPVPPYPKGSEASPFPPILVNVGDLLQFWTRGVLKSTVHRVVFPEGHSRDRYSIAFFSHPLDHITITPVPCKMVQKQDSSTAYPEDLTAAGYLKARLEATYGPSEQSTGVT